MNQRRFSFFADPTKTTSGNGFWQDLCAKLKNSALYDPVHYDSLFCNISVPLRVLLLNKLKGKQILLRVDGVYHEKFCVDCLNRLHNPVIRLFMKGVYLIFRNSNVTSEVFNLFVKNYSPLIKIFLADLLIFQSEFSRRMNQHYFPKKPNTVIPNGQKYSRISSVKDDSAIYLVTTYDYFRPSKRVAELLDFVCWAREQKSQNFQLTLLGYRTDFAPKNLTDQHKKTIETADFVHRVPAFSGFNDQVRSKLGEHHLYLTLTYRDNCPNAVVEALASGLPVVGTRSGGLHDIVGDAGILIDLLDPDDSHFSSFDYSFDYPAFDKGELLDAVLTVISNYQTYQNRVQKRFNDDLDMSVIGQKYIEALNL